MQQILVMLSTERERAPEPLITLMTKKRCFSLQPLWRPELCEAVHVGTEVTAPQSGSPDKCAFCHAVVPQERMNSHLYSHFSHKDGDDDDDDDDD